MGCNRLPSGVYFIGYSLHRVKVTPLGPAVRQHLIRIRK